MTISDDEWSGAILRLGQSILREYDGKVTKILLAFNGEDLVGFIYGFVLPNSVLIPEFMYVKPDQRKNGIAHHLLKALEDSSECSASMIFYNKSLHDFYAKQGYETGSGLETAMKELS